MRIELKEAVNNCSLIVDRDNSFTFRSFEFAFQFLSTQHTHEKISLILYGKCYYDDYEALNKLLLQSGVNRLILIGDCWRAVKHQLEMSATHYRTANDFLAQEQRGIFFNETILIKGVPSQGMFNIESSFQETNERTVLEISLDAVAHNLRYFKSLINPETKIVVMVKAFSYGNGSHEIAHLLRHEKVDFLGVASTDEGVELRHAGIQLPVMIMTPLIDNFDQLIRYNLQPVLYSMRSLIAFFEAVVRTERTAYPIHIKLDSGMHRMGFAPDEMDKLSQLLNQMDNLQVVSVFSHLAGTDEPALDEFTHEQCRLFDRLSADLLAKYKHAHGQKVFRHILNSSGIVRFADKWQFDMVRLGLGLYGSNPFIQDKLQHIGTLKTVITQIKSLPAASTVGYNRKGVLEHDSEIAVLPVGYSDGINRHLSNRRGAVWIKGHLAPIIGNISMNIMSVDVTGIGAEEGDEVVFFGSEYPIDQMAGQLNTIPYEILTSVSKRLRRIYTIEREA